MSGDERDELFEDVSRTNLIPSLKSQLKMAVCDLLRKNRPSRSKRSTSADSECANNIVLEYLYACGFHSTASVFYAESEMHQIPREDVLSLIQVPNTPGLVAELLLCHSSFPSISTQTDSCDLSSKLDAVEQEIRRKRTLGRLKSSEDMLRSGIEKIDAEHETRFNRELAARLDVFRASELLQAQTEDAQKRSAQLAKLKEGMESELRQKTAELRVEYQRDSDVVRTRQRELEREIGQWADRNIASITKEADVSEATKIRESAERKEEKIKEKAIVLARKVERSRRKLEDTQLAHNRAKREIEKLQMAINMYEKKQ